jgi:hypothetical protein
MVVGWDKWNPFTWLVGMQMHAATMEISMVLPQKLKIELSYNSALSFLGIYSKKYKSTNNHNICTPFFIAELFTIAKLWSQPRFLSSDEGVKKQ